jgi:subtilase family serine protease
MKLYSNITLDNSQNDNIQKDNINMNAVVSLGKLRNTIGSITRKFKFCNNNSYNNSAIDCVFDKKYNISIYHPNFETYHILNDISINIDDIENNNEENTNFKSISTGPFTPTQIKKAYSVYNILPTTRIRRAIVTIITAFNNPYLVRDVIKFGEIFKLPPCNLKIYNFSKKFVTNWAVETTLNVQWVYAMNPYAEIRVIQASTSNFIDMTNALKFSNNKNNFNPKIDTDLVNMSWGMPDAGGLSIYNKFFTNSNTIYVASSGNNNYVTFPSSALNVLSIGGTSLNLNANGTRFSEKVWKLSGSGYSRSFTRPTYQPQISQNNLRITPDFSCVADSNTGCYVVINKRLYSIGGTSLSAPIYVGMLSLLTQKRLNENKYTYTSVINKYNSIQPLLYNNINSFFDIVNGTTGTNIANVGFDIASGLGVMNCEKIIKSLG